MKHILISILLMWSVSAQAITRPSIDIENGMIGTCDE